MAGKKKERQHPLIHRIAVTVASLSVLCALTLAASVAWWNLNARTDPTPAHHNPIARALLDQEDTSPQDDDGYPQVDWAYWQGVNPDIIGWITIPGSHVNSPIVQAPSASPDYYLHHDVTKAWNPRGAIYLDADCQPWGLDCQNAVILGHHWDEAHADTVPFTDIHHYLNQAWATHRQTVLIQTPVWKRTLHVRFASVIKGWEPTKRVSFTDASDQQEWYEDTLSKATMVLDGAARPETTVTLVSCSYTRWAWNERTIVIASQDHTFTSTSKEDRDNE